MVQPDARGHVHCPACGHAHHFYGPCLPLPPNPALAPRADAAPGRQTSPPSGPNGTARGPLRPSGGS